MDVDAGGDTVVCAAKDAYDGNETVRVALSVVEISRLGHAVVYLVDAHAQRRLRRGHGCWALQDLTRL